MPAGYDAFIDASQEIRFKGVAFEVQVQLAIVSHNERETLFVSFVPHDCGGVLAYRDVERIVLIGVREGQAKIDEFLASHTITRIQEHFNLPHV